MKRLLNFVKDLFAFRKFNKVDFALTVILTFLTAAFATWLVNFLIDYYPESVPQHLDSVNKILRESGGPLLYSFLISVCLIAPVLEELIFRGALWWVVEKLSSPNIALVVTSILFALAHVELLHVVAVFPLGVLFGFLRLRTKSVWLPMFAHFLNNTLASLSLVF
jgi:membrane protease YdiL (CAAX protease family)